MINRFASIVCFALAALLAVALAFAVLDWFLPPSVSIKDRAGIIQGVVTALAIIFGGLLAAVKLELFRDFEPHLTITHEVSHRRVGDSYVHIAVKAALHNTSKVRVAIRAGIFRIHQIAPMADSEIEDIYFQVFGTRDLLDLQWPTLEEIQPAWDENELTIEPGETHRHTIEFIVSVAHKTVLIYTYFYNPNYSEGRKAPQGWGEATVYDISEKREEPR